MTPVLVHAQGASYKFKKSIFGFCDRGLTGKVVSERGAEYGDCDATG